VRITRIVVTVICAALALVLATLSALILYARTEGGRQRLRILAEKSLHDAVPGLRIGRIDGDYVNDLVLRDVEVRDVEGRQGQPALRVDLVSVKFSLLPLLRHTVRVREVRVQGVDVDAHALPDGSWNLAHLTKSSPTKKPAQPAKTTKDGKPWTVLVERLLVSDVHVRVATATGQTGALDELGLDGGLTLRTGPALDVSTTLETLQVRATWENDPYSLLLRQGQVVLSPREVVAKLETLHASGIRIPGGDVGVSLDVKGPPAAMLTRLAVDAGKGGRLMVDGSVGVSGGPFALPPAPPSREPPPPLILGAYDLTATVMELDPAALAPSAPAGDINFTVAARGQGTPLAPASSADVVLDLASSVMAGVHLMPSQVRAELHDDRWALPRAKLEASGLSLSLSGQGRGPVLVADARVDLDGRLPAPRSKTAPILPDVRGVGSLTVHAAGTVPSNIEVAVRARGRKIVAPGARVGNLAMTIHAHAVVPTSDEPARDATVTLHVRARVANVSAGQAQVQSLSLDGQAQGAVTSPRGRVSVQASRIVLSADAPRLDTFTLMASGDRSRVSIDARATGPKVRAHLAAQGMGSAERADVKVTALDGDITLPTYRQTVAAKGPFDLRFSAGRYVEIVGAAFHGTGYRFDGDLRIDGHYALSHRRTDASWVGLSVSQARFNGMPALEGWMKGRLTPTRADAQLGLSMTTAQAQLAMDASIPLTTGNRGKPQLATHGPVTLHMKSNQIQVQSLPIVHEKLADQGISGGTVSLEVSAEGDIAHPDAKVRFNAHDLMYRNISGFGRDSRIKTVPGLGGSVSLDTEPGSLRTQVALLIRGTGVFKVDAKAQVDLGQALRGVDPQSIPLEATVEIPRLDLASLADFVDGFDGVSGKLHGAVKMEGTLAAPRGEVLLAIDGAKVDKLAFEEVTVQGTADRGLAQAKVVLREVQAGRLDANATVKLAEHQINARAEAHGFDLAFLRAFLPQIRELSGLSDLVVTANGTLPAPTLSGSLDVTRGRLGIVGQPTFRDIALSVKLTSEKAELTKLDMRSADGSLHGKGWITLKNLQPRQVVFTAHANHFLVAAAGNTGGRIDGDLAVEAALQPDVTSGSVHIPRANVWLPKSVMSASGSRNLQKIGQHEDIKFVDRAALAAASRKQKAKQGAAAHPSALDIKVRTGSIFVRGKEVDIELDSHLDVGTVATGPRAGEPTVGGVIQIRHGHILLQGQRFDFDHGNITFNGSADVNPELDIQIQRQYPDAMVEVQIRGTPKKPLLRMTSDPPVYDEAQIVSLLLTGQPGGQGSSSGSFDPTSAVATAVLGRLADEIAPQVGLDVLRVENVQKTTNEGELTGDTDTRVEVGKYISDRIYLSYAHVFGAPQNANQNEAHMEYLITRHWMVETVFGDAGVGGVDTLWTYQY
jgi:autotransporter translocation and assembly factor TamB